MPGPGLASSLRGYRRGWLTGDLVAAATLLAIAIPEQLATSRLAGMPPITGFYCFAAGTLMFALLGSSRQLSVGADSTIAPLFAGAVAGFAAQGPDRYTDLVGILAVMVGVILAVVWLLRLGWIAEFLSAPIITGFLGGIAIVIAVHQLPSLLGVPGGGSSTLGRLHAIGDELGSVHWWPVGIGIGVFAIVIGLERFDRRLPAALVALIASTILVSVAGLQEHGVAVLGHFAHGAPQIGLRGIRLKVIEQLAPIAGLVALVVVTQSTASTRAFARAGGYEVDVGQDLLAIGAGNAIAGLAGAFPVNASPPRTAAVAEAGGRTQLAGLAAAVAMLALIPATGALRDLPLATLAGILMFVATRIFHVGELRRIARFDAFEFGLAMVTLLAVALAGVEEGIGVAIALAILDRTRISARPQMHVLGRIPGTTSWAPLSASEHPQPVPSVLAVLFPTPLWYANATHFRASVLDALGRSGVEPPRALVLDALGMTDIDYTGIEALSDTLDRLDREGIAFAIARAGSTVKAELRRAGLVPQRIAADRFFPDVDEAVVALAGDSSLATGTQA